MIKMRLLQCCKLSNIVPSLVLFFFIICNKFQYVSSKKPSSFVLAISFTKKHTFSCISLSSYVLFFIFFQRVCIYGFCGKESFRIRIECLSAIAQLHQVLGHQEVSSQYHFDFPESGSSNFQAHCPANCTGIKLLDKWLKQLLLAQKQYINVSTRSIQLRSILRV